MFMHLLRAIRSAFFILVMAWSGFAFAAQLITAEEAALPAQKGAVANFGRGITRGPKIQVAEDDTVIRPSPIRFQVRFQALGGSTIDLDSLKVTYLKSPNVDLTARVRPFAQPSGIDMPDALLPPGEHLVRIDLRDSEGRVSTTSFLLKIAP